MRKSKDEIIAELKQSFLALQKASTAVSAGSFNLSKGDKWSAAQNIKHLLTGTKVTAMAFKQPKILLVLLYGKPQHTSHAYSKLVDNYHQKLAAGAVATGVFVPEKTDYNRAVLTAKLQNEGAKLITAIESKWSDAQLDHYQVKHPLLGLITMRELAYFTIYHNGHHLASIEKCCLNEEMRK